MDREEPNQVIKIVSCNAVFFLEFVICMDIRFFFCVQLDPSFNILCVQQKNKCIPGRKTHSGYFSDQVN